MEAKFTRARLLIVDDEEDNVEVLRRILEAEGYEEIRTTSDPCEVAVLTVDYDPDLILMDIVMPVMDGHAVLRRLKELELLTPYRPVLVLTADHSRQAQREAWEGGANDFLTKPLSPSEVRLRVRNLLETRMLHKTLSRQNELLEDRVKERTAELEEARLQVLYRLARAAEYRDDDTGQHTRRVGKCSSQIALALGMSSCESSRIQMTAPLHDVGKIGIPDTILLSTQALSDRDFRVMKTHCEMGADLLTSSEVPLLQLAAEIALTHHERWDGTGYPHGLGERDIPLSGRIVAVADTFDALTHARPYKKAWTRDAALDELRSLAGVAFDPEVLRAFESVADTELVAASTEVT